MNDELLPSQMMSDDLRIESLLKQGDYHAYYNAHHMTTDREVTVKILRAEKAKSPESCEIFLSSARLTARLEHPHIDIIYDIGMYEGRPFLTRRSLVHGSIRRLLREQRQISVAEKRRILREVADALDYAHSLGVIHANLKPSNVLFDARDRPYVLDFMVASGASSRVDQDVSEYYQYMSPERLQNQALSPQSDIFSLASTAFIFLSGVAPFQANSISEHIRARSQQVPALRQVAPHFSEEIEAILQKSLHPDPQERHQTASEFTTALWNALQKMDYQGKASVFISHADIDSDFALQLAESLEANQIGVWLDKKDLSPGQIWEKAIRKAIQETDKFLVLLSPEAVDSRYVQAEMDFALEKEKPIIPIAHRPCEIPLYIRSLQRLDFSLLGYSRGLELLVRALLA